MFSYHCVKSVRIRSYNAGKCLYSEFIIRENTDQNNFEYGNTFYAVYTWNIVTKSFL